MEINQKIAIIGGGNIGSALALGFVRKGGLPAGNVVVSRKRKNVSAKLEEAQIKIFYDNHKVIKDAGFIILAVRPAQVISLLREISPELDKGQIIVSVAPAVTIRQMSDITPAGVPVFRAMPNIAALEGESVTALAPPEANHPGSKSVEQLFERVGKTYWADESLIESSVVLNACGIAYFLRVIRAVMQGGIQIGFHAPDAREIAAQVARGAATLLLESGDHPEQKVDQVTTPRGITIAGLNEMEHYGMSSALIRGIMASFREIEKMKNE